MLLKALLPILLLAATVKTKPVILTWKPSVTPNAGGQWVRCGFTHGGPYAAKVRNLKKTATTTTFSALFAGTTYYCVVTTVGKTGQSGASNEVSFTP
jgi:hypothetical protein